MWRTNDGATWRGGEGASATPKCQVPEFIEGRRERGGDLARWFLSLSKEETKQFRSYTPKGLKINSPGFSDEGALPRVRNRDKITVREEMFNKTRDPSSDGRFKRMTKRRLGDMEHVTSKTETGDPGLNAITSRILAASRRPIL